MKHYTSRLLLATALVVGGPISGMGKQYEGPIQPASSVTGDKSTSFSRCLAWSIIDTWAYQAFCSSIDIRQAPLKKKRYPNRTEAQQACTHAGGLLRQEGEKIICDLEDGPEVKLRIGK